MSESEIGAAVDAALGGWEIAFLTNGAILPVNGSVDVITTMMEMIDMEMLEYRIKRARIAAKKMETHAQHHREKGEPDGPTYQRGMRTINKWLDGTHPALGGA